jgi:hypothetical protein
VQKGGGCYEFGNANSKLLKKSCGVYVSPFETSRSKVDMNPKVVGEF